MKIVNENNWKTVGNITLEKNALDAIKCEKNTLVIAGPGAGKTELLAQKAFIFLKPIYVVHHRRFWQLALKKIRQKI